MSAGREVIGQRNFLTMPRVKVTTAEGGMNTINPRWTTQAAEHML